MASRRKKVPFGRRVTKAFRKAARSRRFARRYLAAALVVLGATTVLWSVIGALIELGNADQLADSFLFGDPAATRGALLPAQHTFLLKFPLFLLVGLFGSSQTAFVVATVFLSLLTVTGLALILSRIEKRPIVLGTILFALAAVLLYIPAQSYPGSLLPANFAMLTTRNIEYVLFTGALILTLKARRLRSVAFVGGTVALILLFASDKLFVSLSAGTAVLGGLAFLFVRRRAVVTPALRLLIATVIGYAGAWLVLWLLGLAGLHFDNGGSAVGPYGLVHSAKDAGIAVVYSVLGILTNFGANPAYDAVIVKDIPLHVLRGVVSWAGPGYIATVGVVVVVVRGAIGAVKSAFAKPRGRRDKAPQWQVLLPFFLLMTTVSAVLVFIVSNHYYPADSRYLTIALFAGFVALAAAGKGRVNAPRIAVLGIVCALAAVFGVVFQFHNLAAQNRVMSEIDRRDALVTAALKSHPVSTLVGDYWRVLPIRLKSPALQVTPLETCTTERHVLSSAAWQPDLTTVRFAYLLRLDGSLANAPDCTLKQVTDAYGRPDSSVVIAGTRADPKELLLFYDEGVHFLKTPAANNTPSDTVTPISLATIPNTACPTKTIMQFTAHEDDDILFMNPDLQHDLSAGNCVRSVFFTAGDAGSNELYWLGRQHGAEAAYGTMLGTPNVTWTERIVALDSSHVVTVANPRGNHAVSLIFLHLPDGNPEGTGFPSEHFESLRKLYERSIPAIHPVDDRAASYTYDDLTAGLTHLMETYQPSEIRTQSTDPGTDIKDHSDHNTVGEFTTTAYGAYELTHPQTSLTYYRGYPIHTLPANVTGTDYTQKVAAFLAFGKYDAATCHTLQQCDNNAVYGIYLSRQYTAPF